MSESNIERSKPNRSERERRASHHRQHRRESSPELECCRHCGSPLVELVESAECGDGCSVLLRCPECFAFERVRCSAAELDRYENVLDSMPSARHRPCAAGGGEHARVHRAVPRGARPRADSPRGLLAGRDACGRSTRADRRTVPGARLTFAGFTVTRTSAHCEASTRTTAHHNRNLSALPSVAN